MMKSLLLSLVAVLAFISVTSARSARPVISVVKKGKCPKPPIEENFDIARFVGVWYQFERFPTRFEVGLFCSFANFTFVDDTSFDIVKSGVKNVKTATGIFPEIKVADGNATVVDPRRPAELIAFIGPMPPPVTDPNFIVVETDYVNYAVIFSCFETRIRGFRRQGFRRLGYRRLGYRKGFIVKNTQSVWILTRGRGERPDNLRDIKQRLRNAGIDTSQFITISQNNCIN